MRKSYAFQLAKIVGTATLNGWSQIHTFTPDNGEKKEKRGTLLAVIMFAKRDSEVEALNFGREIISRLHEEYYGEESGPILPHLSSVLKKINDEFGREEKLEIISGVISADVLYLAILGGGKILMKRGESLEVILGGQVGQVESASGYLTEKDRLVFGTSDFYAALPEGVLRASLENETIEEATENIIPAVYHQGDDSLVAGLIVQINEEREEELAVPETDLVMEEEVKKEDLPKKKPLFVFSNILRKISALFPQEIRIHDAYREENKRRKVLLTIAVVLIILLSASVILGKEKRSSQNKNTQFLTLEQEISQKLDSAQAVLTLNPQEAKTLILAAQVQWEEMQKLAIEKEKTDQLRERIEEMLPQVIKEYQVEDLETYFDLGLISSDGKGTKLSLTGNELAILDKEKSLVFSVDLEKKAGEILAGSETIPSAFEVASYDDRVFVLGEKGITLTNLKTKKTEVIVKNDLLPEKILAMTAFGGNLYLISEDNLWRVTAGETGYSSPKSWLAEGMERNFVNFSSMAIDGSIWLINKNGEINKYVSGNKVGFGPSGLDKNIGAEAKIFTDYDTQNLYLLDKINQRIVVLKKSGEYQSQYLSEGLGQTVDFAVSEKMGKIFLLSGSKILVINIK